VGRSLSCPGTALPLTALMPTIPGTIIKDNARIPINNVWGQTTQERPLLWVYVPYSTSANDKFDLKLMLHNERGEPLDHTNIPLPRQPGIVPISLPSTVKLEVGKSYQATLFPTCIPNNPTNLQVWIQRISVPKDSPTLDQKPSEDLAQFYAQNGIWLDTLTEVVKLNSPAAKFSPEWQNFIQDSLGLTTVPTSNPESDQTPPVKNPPKPQGNLIKEEDILKEILKARLN